MSKALPSPPPTHHRVPIEGTGKRHGGMAANSRKMTFAHAFNS